MGVSIQLIILKKNDSFNSQKYPDVPFSRFDYIKAVRELILAKTNFGEFSGLIELLFQFRLVM